MGSKYVRIEVICISPLYWNGRMIVCLDTAVGVVKMTIKVQEAGDLKAKE